MSLPPRILCRVGCGDYGDPELNYLCGDCYGDKVEIEKQQALLNYIREKEAKKAPASRDDTGRIVDGSPSPSSRRTPPSVNHGTALEEFMARPREKDIQIVARECMFLEREREIRETCKDQLRKFMIATDVDETVDPKEWGRYQYGPPKNIPRNDVDQETELSAQIKLFCYWRRRTLNRRIATRRQLLDQQRRADGKKRKSTKIILPRLSISKSVKNIRSSVSGRILAIAGQENDNAKDKSPQGATIN